MAVFDTYDAVGQAEDVADTIANIDPYNTPLYTLSKKGAATATHPEYQEDVLAAAKANARIDGADAPAADLSPTTMLENWTQIISDTASTSGTLDTVDKYGRSTEMAYQLVKVGRQLMRDIEYAVVGLAQAGGAGVQATTGRTMKSASVQVNADTTIASTSGATLSETDILSAHQATYTHGGDPSVLLINPGHALTVAGFAAAAGRMRDFDTGQQLVNAIDLYVSPFGSMSVVLDRFQRTSEVYLVDPAYWESKTLRSMRTIPLAKTGDSNNVQLLTELCICATNTRATGMVDTIA